MANKLYTEEQVKEIVEKSRETGLTAEYLILTTPPIELPSDEEIEDQANKVHNELFDEFYSYTDGAKWLRDKILNKNK